jgi:hypothetical protein
MRDFLVSTVALKVHGRGKTMGKGIAVDVGSHGTKRKASQKLAFSIAIVKLSPVLSGACGHGWAYSFFHCPVEIASVDPADANA